MFERKLSSNEKLKWKQKAGVLVIEKPKDPPINITKVFKIERN